MLRLDSCTRYVPIASSYRSDSASSRSTSAAFFYTLDAVFHFSVMEEPVDRVRIALVHTGFNLAATAFMLPLSKWLEKLAVWTIPDSAAEPEQVQLLDSRLLATPAAAVDRSPNSRPGGPGRPYPQLWKSSGPLPQPASPKGGGGTAGGGIRPV